MAYSSYSPNEESVGFSTSGIFKCAYDSVRVIVIAFLISLGVLLLGILISFVLCYELLFTPVDINAAAAAGERGERQIFGFNPAEYGLTAIGMVFLFWLEIVGIIAFAITLAVLKTGITCTFKANENYMEIVEQVKNPRTTVIFYNDVINVTATERKFLFLSGINVTVYTKQNFFEYRYIHNHLSKTGGLSETPFNIIMERAELVSKPNY
ncbi:MAG: hypothetical protein IJY73_08510, partial [Oscillospiraceae bacterium]|nr:hypothetical protein [Oscillospiraceae bacterium]